MANNSYKLENMLISSSAHLRSQELKSYFKDIKDLNFDGLSNKYENHSMTRTQGNRYVMHVSNYDRGNDELYCVDFGTMKAERLDLNIGYGTITRCFVKGDHMLLVRYDQLMTILRDLQVIGYIEFNVKRERCKNGHILIGRYVQQAGHTVYAVDAYTRLYRIEWQDIKDGKYAKTLLVKSNVNNFYVDRRLGLATLNLNHTLSLPNGTKVDLKAKVDAKATWTIVACIAKCWIVCGDLESNGYAIMACISRQGRVRKPLKLKLTSNGHVNRGVVEFAGIYSLHQAYVSGRRGIMLAIGRDGCCHLISVAYGRLSKLQSIDSIVNVDVVKDESDRIVHSVTATGIVGEFIAGGENWTKKITLKLI